MPAWEQHSLDERIREILASMPPETTYGSGRPFLTTYQIAIAFKDRYPEVFAALGHELGGAGDGPFALTTYLARWLPTRIRKGTIKDMEVAFLAPDYLTTVEYNDDGNPVVATSHQAGWNTTMFRLK